MSRRALLGTDAIVNLVLGTFLIVFPARLVEMLGVPAAESAFYPSILGAVLFGIGIALVLEVMGDQQRAIGLGLGGAVCINLCGGLVLAAWLVGGDLGVPVRGVVLLWTLAALLVGLSTLEAITQARRLRSRHAV